MASDRSLARGGQRGRPAGMLMHAGPAGTAEGPDWELGGGSFVLGGGAWGRWH